MTSCDLCGKQSRLIDAIVEGSMVSVCESCIKFGKVVAVKKPNLYYENQPRKKIILKKSEIEEIIVSNYASLIKQTRESLKLKQDKLAKMLGIKESLIHQIESSHLKPSMELAKKFQTFFKIKLIEIHEEKQTNQEVNLSKTTLTIGDLIKFKKHE